MHGLLIAALTALCTRHSARGSEGLLYLPCGAGLGPCPLLLKATSKHERPAAARQLRRSSSSSNASRSGRTTCTTCSPCSEELATCMGC